MHSQYAPLTDDDRAALNSVDTPEHERTRLYARDLRSTADAYAVAADAPGLRKDAARYLYAESLRLTRESMAYFERANAEEPCTVQGWHWHSNENRSVRHACSYTGPHAEHAYTGHIGGQVITL